MEDRLTITDDGILRYEAEENKKILNILLNHIEFELFYKDEHQIPNRMYCSPKSTATSQGIKAGYAPLTDEEFEILYKAIQERKDRLG